MCFCLVVHCSFDKRGYHLLDAKRWSDEAEFGNRATFNFDKDPAELVVQNVQASDDAVYRCRVDFQIRQSRNSIVKLSIIRELFRHYYTIVDMYIHSITETKQPNAIFTLSTV